MRTIAALTLAALMTAIATPIAAAEPSEPPQLADLDAFMNKAIHDWNAPGAAIGVVVGDRLVFARGYGYRDFNKKLPFTRHTLFQIASNTKLFTAVACGLLVDQGKLTWDEPVRESVPSIRFYDDKLTNSVTLRDMLSHRTGITRHDTIWLVNHLTPKQMFEKLQYLEPQVPLRTEFLYNNIMYAAAGYLIQLQSGKRWAPFVNDTILDPLDMRSTVFNTNRMKQISSDYFVPYAQRSGSSLLYEIPYDQDSEEGIAPAGDIVSNVDDMSHWLIALLNGGRYGGRQAIPQDVLAATEQSAVPVENTGGETLGWWEAGNITYGMGRFIEDYRGHRLIEHGGDNFGIHSRVAILPNDHIGIVVAVIGDHAAALTQIATYAALEKMLGMSLTPWSARFQGLVRSREQADAEAAKQKASGKVSNAPPSHPLEAYTGLFRNPAYGDVEITNVSNGLRLKLYEFKSALSHFHYDRFDSAEDEKFGSVSLLFRTNSVGDIDGFVTSLDEGDVTFNRVPEPLTQAQLLSLAGTYLAPGNQKVFVRYTPGTGLTLSAPNAATRPMLQVQGFKFRVADFSNVFFRFEREGSTITSLLVSDPSGEVRYPRDMHGNP